MPWQKRRGHWYFYHYGPDATGKMKKHYLGRGFQAAIAHGFEIAQQEQARQKLEFRRACLETYQQTKTHIQTAQKLLNLALEHCGYHNPDFRGLRRAKKMVDFGNSDSEDNSGKPTPQVLQKTIKACNEGGAAAAIKIRGWLKEYPELFSGPESVSEQTKMMLIKKISTDAYTRELLFAKTENLKSSLINEGSGTVLESLAVDLVITTHLFQNFWALSAVAGLGDDKSIDLAIKAACYSTDRYRRSIETLSAIRGILGSGKPATPTKKSQLEKQTATSNRATQENTKATPAIRSKTRKRVSQPAPCQAASAQNPG